MNITNRRHREVFCVKPKELDIKKKPATPWTKEKGVAWLKLSERIQNKADKTLRMHLV